MAQRQRMTMCLTTTYGKPQATPGLSRHAIVTSTPRRPLTLPSAPPPPSAPGCGSTVHVPKVKIRSSQQFSSLTFIFHVFPDLSCAVAEVPVVITLSGRECCCDSVGGCSILTVGG